MPPRISMRILKQTNPDTLLTTSKLKRMFRIVKKNPSAFHDMENFFKCLDGENPRSYSYKFTPTNENTIVIEAEKYWYAYTLHPSEHSVQRLCVFPKSGM